MELFFCGIMCGYIYVLSIHACLCVCALKCLCVDLLVCLCIEVFMYGLISVFMDLWVCGFVLLCDYVK